MDEKAERAAFEAWAPTYHKLTNPGPLTRLDGNGRYFYGPVNASWAAWKARAALAAAPAPAPRSKADRVHAIVDAGPYPGMSAAFDAHMGAECWTDPAYRQDAATWAAAWKAAVRVTAAPAPASVLAYMAANREGEVRFTDNAKEAAELERDGWAITPLSQAPAPLTYEQIEALRCIDDCGEAAPEFSRIVRIAERALGIGTDAAPAQHPDTADAMKEPKNGNDWHVVWCNESARLMLPGIDAARAHGIGTDAAPAQHPDTADAERWRFTRDNRVQYFEPTKLWRMTDANGRLVREGVADSYEAAIDAARAQAQGSKP